MSAPQQLERALLDRRLASLRLTNLHEMRRLRASILEEGVRDPVLVSTDVEAGYLVMVDGFKRLLVADELGMKHLWVYTAPLDAAHAKAAILRRNQPRKGLCKLEEAWIVHSLCRDDGLRQTQVAELIKRDKSWVCRRLKLARALDESLQEDVRQGLLSATIASQLSQLQRCNQQPVARAVIEHHLSSRECKRFVQKLRDTHDPQAVRQMLEDPRGYIAPAKNGGERTSGSDPRLSEEGNRLRSSLLSWQSDCARLTDQLRRASAADARVLAPLMQDAIAEGTRAVRQLEATQRTCSVSPPSTPGEPPFVSPAP